jgi:hypothetical protein
LEVERWAFGQEGGLLDNQVGGLRTPRPEGRIYGEKVDDDRALGEVCLRYR